MRRMRIRTIEIEVDLDESEIETIVRRALGVERTRSNGGTQALPQAPIIEAQPASPVRPTKATSRTRKKRSTKRRATPVAGEAHSERSNAIDALITQLTDNHERYNAALRQHEKMVDRAMLIIHLARDRFDINGLTSVEISRVLQEKFSVVGKESSIRMALMKGASQRNPLLAATKTERGEKLYVRCRSGTR